MRIGAKKRPFYRVVAVDERKKRTGEYIELLGTYNPLTEPKEIILKKDRLEYWQKQGAVLSDGFLRITKQARQKPPRKPKKDKEPSDKKQEEDVREQVEEKQEVAEEIKEEAAVDAETVATEQVEPTDNEQPTTN